MNPRPTPDRIGHAYSNYYTHERRDVSSKSPSVISKLRRGVANDYRRSRFGATLKPRLPFGAWLVKRLPAYRSRIEAYYRYLPATPGLLLDFGCGDGAFLRLARDELGWEVQGIDCDSKAVAAATATGLDITVGGVDKLREFKNEFDAITLSHVIEHVFQPQELVAASLAALKPGGLMFVEAPNYQSACHKAFGQYWRGLEVPRHLAIPSWRSMELLLQNSGFVDVKRYPRFEVLDQIWRQSSALAEGRNSEHMDVRDEKGPPSKIKQDLRGKPDFCEYVTFTALKR